MRYASMAVGVVTAAFVAWAGPVAAAKQNFELVNRTGYDISEVYVSPTKSDDWEEDVLGMDILENGEASNIIFERGVRTCRWDLKVVYDDDDSSAVWTNIDLCAVRQITIRYNRKTDTTSATFK